MKSIVEETASKDISLWAIAFIAAGIVTGGAMGPMWTTVRVENCLCANSYCFQPLTKLMQQLKMRLQLGLYAFPIRKSCNGFLKTYQVAKGARNMALFNVGSVVGPLVGIFVGGLCLELLWVDLDADVELNSNDQNWIGAWWLPYFANGLLGLVMCLPVFGFPDQFPG